MKTTRGQGFQPVVKLATQAGILCHNIGKLESAARLKSPALKEKRKDVELPQPQLLN